MSKKKAKRKKAVKEKPKKKIRKMPIAVAAIACVLIAAVIVLISCSVIKAQTEKRSELCGVSWVSASAFDSSGDEADLADVYNTNYSSYRGTLNFKEDGTFSLWLTPGSAEDGTHTGSYEVEDSSVVSVKFDGGTESAFFISRDDDGDIDYIAVFYDGYEVRFTEQ